MSTSNSKRNPIPVWALLQSAPERWYIAFILFLAIAWLGYYLWVELGMTGGEIGVPLDDAWIHYQFARNLSQGNGFSYVPGVPAPGSTSPAWTLLLAGVGLFTQQYVWPSLILSAAFLLVTLCLTFRLAVDVTANKLAGAMAALATLFAGRMLWAGLSAMEVTLFAALSLAAVWAYRRWGLGWGTAVLFALAALSRPEGHLLFAFAFLDTFLTAPNPLTALRANWRKLAGAFLMYALIQLPYVWFSLSVTGRPLPNTFYAKSNAAAGYSWRALGETARFHWRDNFLSLLLLPFGLLYTWPRHRLIGMWWLGLILLIPFIIPFTWHHGRYTLPLIPFQMILAAAGIHWLAKKLPGSQHHLFAIFSILFLLAGANRLPYWAVMLGNNVREIQEIDIAMGQWIAQNIPADETIAVDDIGAIVFFSPRPIVDLNGLVSPEMWPVMADEDFNTAAIHLLADANVTYLAVFPKWHPPLVNDPAMARPIQRFRTETHTIIGEQEAVVYEMDWPYRSRIEPQFERLTRLGGVIIFRGYDFAVTPDQSALTLTLYWESAAAVTANYKVFVHVMDEDGRIVAQVDRFPANGMAPTHRWQPGDLVRDPYQIPLPPDLPAGSYQVTIGLYTEAAGRLTAVGENAADNAIWITDWERQR